jgi:hypothetical protein
MLVVLKSLNLNLLEPSGPVQACPGIYLPGIYCEIFLTLYPGDPFSARHLLLYQRFFHCVVLLPEDLMALLWKKMSLVGDRYLEKPSERKLY